MTAMVWQRALPGPLQTRALRVALRLDPAAREDWERWVQATPGLKYVLGADRKGVKRILALIYHGLRRNEAGMDPETRTYLRTAYARERTRTEVVRRITRELLELFRTAGIPNLVLKGMLAAETVYPEASLRHCHDLDLWIAPADTKDAGRVLAEAGYRANPDFPNVFQHASGFPVSLQHRLFRAGAPKDNPTPPSPSQQAEIAGVSAAVLCPEQNLAHICAHAATTGSRISPCWVADAWYLIERETVLDWNRVIAGRHLALPLSITLGYLADRLGAPVPRDILQQVRDRANGAGLGERLRMTAWMARIQAPRAARWLE